MHCYLRGYKGMGFGTWKKKIESLHVEGLEPSKRSYLHFWRKMRFWYQNDPFNTENHFMLTNVCNTSMAWYPQKMVGLSALCHNVFRAKRSHLAERTMWTNQNQFHKALVSFTSICLVPKGPIWALFAHQERNFR